MGGFRLTDVSNPVNANDAANKAYVDANAGGTEVKDIWRYTLQI
ncbi:MAG: hypothetical protein QXU32_01840 [Nitrososphaerales archaeon]